MRPSDATLDQLARSGYLLFHVYRLSWPNPYNYLGSRLAHDAHEACYMLGVRGPSEDSTIVVESADPTQLFLDARQPQGE